MLFFSKDRVKRWVLDDDSIILDPAEQKNTTMLTPRSSVGKVSPKSRTDCTEKSTRHQR